MGRIRTRGKLNVYRRAFETVMAIFTVRAGVLTVPVVARRGGSARRRPQPRRDAGHNLGETQACREHSRTVWLEFAVKCGYLDAETARNLYKTYAHILGELVTMLRHSETWVIGH